MCSHFLKTKRVTKLLKYCNVHSRDAHTGHCLFKYGLLSLRMRGHIYVEFAPTWGAATSQRELYAGSLNGGRGGQNALIERLSAHWDEEDVYIHWGSTLSLRSLSSWAWKTAKKYADYG